MAADRYARWILLALAVFTALAFQGSRGLYETTEGRYAEIAREMLRSGDYLTPTLDGTPHWTKPPLTYWAIAAGVRVFGLNAWGARFYNVIALVVTVLAVAACGAALWDRTTGIVSGLVYASSIAPAMGAAVITTDMLLAMWETLAVLCYMRAFAGDPDSGRRTWLRMMWLGFGLAFFTKGPPGLLPLLAIIVFHLVARRPFTLLDPIGVVVFLAASVWWFALSATRHPDLAAYFLGKEVVARSVSSEFRRNAQWWGGLVIYVPWLLVGQGVWLYDGVRLVKSEGLLSPRRLKRLFDSRRSAGLFLCLWFSIPLAVFFLSKSRLQLYVLPLFSPVALATARFCVRSLGGETALRRTMRIAVIASTLIVVGKGIAAYWPGSRDARSLFEAAKRAGGSDATYVLFREAKLYGFEFYADAKVRRVSTSPTDRWADQNLPSLISDVSGAPEVRRYVIISASKFAPQVSGALSEANLAYSAGEHRGWKLLAVGGRRP